MQTRNLFLILSIIAVLCLIFMQSCRDDIGGIKEESLALIGESNKQAIERCLKLQVLDKSFQWDGKVMIAYTNICQEYQFQLDKTGLKYTTGGKTEYLIRDTPVFLEGGGTNTMEISIPFGIRPRVAYVLADDAKGSKVQ